jgi:hypothetical protein
MDPSTRSPPVSQARGSELLPISIVTSPTMPTHLDEGGEFGVEAKVRALSEDALGPHVLRTVTEMTEIEIWNCVPSLSIW